MIIRKLTQEDASNYKKLRIEAVEDSPSSFYPTRVELINTINVAAKALYLACGFNAYGIERNSLCVNGVFFHEEYMMMELSR